MIRGSKFDFRTAVVIQLLIFLAGSFYAKSQGSDVLLLKKNNGKTVKTYTAGAFISFRDVNGRWVEGTINKIKDDTLYINDYDVRKAYTIWGTTVQDTLTSFMRRFHYTEISAINKERQPFEFIRNGTLFIIGGSTYALLHVINALIQKTDIRANALLISGGVIAAGVTMKLLHKRSYKIGNHFSFRYLDLTQ